MKIRDICFDARMLLCGGIGTYIRNLLPGLKQFFPQLKVIVHPKIVESEMWLRKYDLILSSTSIYSLREQIEFFLRTPKVDLFFSPHYNIPLLPIRAAKRVVTIHDVFHLAYISSFRWHEQLYAKYVIQQAVYKSDLVITDSQFSFDEICKYTKGAKNKIHCIHCGVDSQIYRREENEAQIRDVMKKFSLPSRYFLFVGNLKPHKNLQGIFLAMKELAFDIQLIVIGKSEGMRHVDTGEVIYRQYPCLRGRILWLSSVSDKELPIFYQLAEALVFPSYYEGFGLPPLEAMSCGCPVIASNLASLPEVCGSAALYVSPGNPREIALAMHTIVSDSKLRKALIRKGYKKISKFNWEKSVARHIELIESF